MGFSARVVGELTVLSLAAALLGGCVSVSEYRKLERDVRTLQAKQTGAPGVVSRSRTSGRVSTACKAICSGWKVAWRWWSTTRRKP